MERLRLFDCPVIDYSAGGACLRADGDGLLPQQFELVYGSTKKLCTIAWKAGRRNRKIPRAESA